MRMPLSHSPEHITDHGWCKYLISQFRRCISELQMSPTLAWCYEGLHRPEPRFSPESHTGARNGAKCTNVNAPWGSVSLSRRTLAIHYNSKES